jgi:DeoR/GlpR family transcriptional regulator of sugar metabolism
MRSFVGSGAGLMLREMRVDKAFIVAGGLSLDFGLSSVTPQEAEVRKAMIEAAREVVVLADHTVLQNESNHRVGPLDLADTVITDAGIRAAQSLELSQLGIRVVVAGRVVNQD